MALEQHAVPTEVTTYEFRLVGDMTLKQFGWLAGGIILAIFWYSLPIPSYFKWPLVITFGLMGAAIAFVPYEGRTLDRWIISFIKAIYSPTEFIWQKERRIPAYMESHSRVKMPTGEVSKMTSQEQAKLREYIQSLPVTASVNQVDAHEDQMLSHISSMFQDQSASPSPVTNNPYINSISDGYGNTVTSSTPTLIPNQANPIPITDISSVINQIPDNVNTSSSIDLPVTPTAAELENLSQQIASQTGYQTQDNQNQINQDLSDQPISDLAQILASDVQTAPIESSQTARNSVTPVPTGPQGSFMPLEPEIQVAMAAPQNNTNNPSASRHEVSPSPKSIDTKAIVDALLPPAPQQPNIIVGTVVDDQQHTIENAIIEIIDSQNQPVRALKTNKLGQFAIATPLKNDTYHIHADKDPHQFPILTVTLEGKPHPPIGIQAKN